MNLDEALAIYLYLKDQADPTKEQRDQCRTAWKMICEQAEWGLMRGLALPQKERG